MHIKKGKERNFFPKLLQTISFPTDFISKREIKKSADKVRKGIQTTKSSSSFFFSDNDYVLSTK